MIPRRMGLPLVFLTLAWALVACSPAAPEGPAEVVPTGEPQQTSSGVDERCGSADEQVSEEDAEADLGFDLPSGAACFGKSEPSSGVGGFTTVYYDDIDSLQVDNIVSAAVAAGYVDDGGSTADAWYLLTADPADGELSIETSDEQTRVQLKRYR